MRAHRKIFLCPTHCMHGVSEQTTGTWRMMLIIEGIKKDASSAGSELL